jgi:hypothetical protein
MDIGDCGANVLFAPLEDYCSGHADILDLIFADNDLCPDRTAQAYITLSRKMVEIEIAGETAYIQSAIESNKAYQWVGQTEVVNLHAELLKLNVTLHSSSLYLVAEKYGQMPQKLSGMEPTEERLKGDRDFLCLHTLHKGPSHANSAVLCIMAKDSAQSCCRYWKHLGAAVSHVVNNHNSSGAFRIHRLRMQDRMGIRGPAYQSFLKEISSMD